jgi:hypothetical protein
VEIPKEVSASPYKSAAALVALCLAGCFGVIKTGQSVKSPASAEIAVVVAYSAPGESFAERGTKRFYLSLRADNAEPPTYLFKKDLSIVANRPNWYVRWVSPDEVTFSICETDSAPAEGPDCERRAVATVRAIRTAGAKAFNE